MEILRAHRRSSSLGSSAVKFLAAESTALILHLPALKSGETTATILVVGMSLVFCNCAEVAMSEFRDSEGPSDTAVRASMTKCKFASGATACPSSSLPEQGSHAVAAIVDGGPFADSPHALLTDWGSVPTSVHSPTAGPDVEEPGKTTRCLFVAFCNFCSRADRRWCHGDKHPHTVQEYALMVANRKCVLR
jgi:hypothetical protein